MLKTAAAVALVFLFVVLGLVSVNSELHQRLCANADTQDHQCAVTLFSQGHMDTLDGAPLLMHFLGVLTQEVAPSIPLELPSVDFLLLPERAPPIAVS